MFRALNLEMPSEHLLARAGGHFVGIPGPAVRARQAALHAANQQAPQPQAQPAPGQQVQQGQQINRAARGGGAAEGANLPNP